MSRRNPKRSHPHPAPVRELLALTLVPKLGAQRIRLLMQHADHPQDIFRMSRKSLEAIEGIGPAVSDTIRKFNDWDEADRLLEETEKTGARIISWFDKEYPKLLREIYDPPVLLWLKGEVSALNIPGIAVVGTRRPSGYGVKKAEQFAGELVRKGLSVVSGLAYGIDAAAHKAALAAGGTTVAVLGSGIDTVYPGRHAGLAQDIAEKGGAFITEFPPGTKPDAGNFPVRNRIVSGLTLGTLVIESGMEGGSMITARLALDQNREVFALPHSLDNRSGVGCNVMIKRSWAKLVQDIEDILMEIPFESGEKPSAKRSTVARWKSLELDELSVSICGLLEQRSYHIDDLGEALGLASHELLPKLLELEMMDCIRQTAGKNFELR